MEYTQPALLTEKLMLIKNLIYSKKLTIPIWRTRTAHYTEPVAYTDYSEWKGLLRSCVAQPKQPVIPREFLSVAHDSLVVDTFKQAEDGNGYILRLYESCCAGGQATVRFARPIKALSTCDLMEQGDEPAAFAENTFCFETTPYCIHTYRVRF